MFAHYLVFTVFSTVTFALTNDDLSLHQYRGHIIKNNGEYQTVIELARSYQEPDSLADNVVAIGIWNQTYNVTGWSILEIKTSENHTDIDQVYTAGLLEGQFTHG